MTLPRPKPNIDEDIAPFWEAAQQRRFVLMRCLECGTWYWPAAYCRKHPNKPFFGSLEWREASGKGRIFAFNVHRRPLHPAFQDKVPYVFALIELNEGPMFGSNILGCEPSAVHIGMPVAVSFDAEEDGFLLPFFRPAI